MCADSCSVSVPPPVLPKWHVEDLGHSAKSAGGKLCLNTHTPLTQRSRSGLTTPLCRHSVGTDPLAEPLWTDPDLESGINEREIIKIILKKLSAGGQ